MATHIGIRPAHEVAIQYDLAHLCRDDHGLYAIPAPNFLGYGAFEVVDLEVLHERARCRRDLISALQTFNLKPSLAHMRGKHSVFMWKPYGNAGGTLSRRELRRRAERHIVHTDHEATADKAIFFWNVVGI